MAPPSHRSRKRIELAEESAGEGNADQRGQKEDQQAAEQRRAVDESAKIVDQRQLGRRIR
jgi:predicted MarR family transcription regulator